MYFMAVKKSRKQVLVSDLFIFKRRCIYRDTETTVVLSEFTCKIVFKKKNSRIGKPSNALACVAGGLEVVGTRKNGVHPSRVSRARARYLFRALLPGY